MKWAICVTALVMCWGACVQAQQQNSSLKNTLLYLEQRKEVGRAVAYWLLIPGGGEFYADNSMMGAAYLGVGVVSALIIFDKNTKPRTKSTWLVILSVSRLAELAMSIGDVDSYNEHLRLEMGIAMSAVDHSPGIQLSLKF